MKRTVLLFLLFTGLAPAQSVPSPGEIAESPLPPPPSAPAAHHAPVTPKTASAPAVPAAPSTPLDRLTEANHDLLEVLKKQQAVLEDIQYDRRLQNRQIQLLEERFEDMIQKNGELQAKVARLQATASAPAPAAGAPDAPPVTPTTPPPPATYLPAPESPGAPGTYSWHRLLTLSGSDSRSTDLFTIHGKQWRVLWHNQDRPGDAYKNTSALFINAFPKDDTIPKKVCSKLGGGGDSTELTGAGTYFLKVEASGGKWELAVEDFR